MLNLIDLWNNVKKQTAANTLTGNEKYPESTKPGAISFDKNTIQSSFDFDESPNVIFVNNLSDLSPVESYDDLAELKLSSEEEAIRQKVIEEQKAKNPKFYDGEQMLIAGVAYDKDTNTVFLVAKKVPYSIIVCLSQKHFPESSTLYNLSLFKTGVLAPLITRDGQTFILQRKVDTLFSVPAGFLEPQGDEKRLKLDGNDNIVCATAKAEITEEIAGIAGEDNLRFEFSDPQISAVSFRSSTGPIGTIEFVAPSYANCHSSFLQQVVNNNLAQDADEHTGIHEIVPLDSSQRNELLGLLLNNTTKIPGSALFLPVVLSLTRIFNKTTSMVELPRQVPNSNTRAFPIRLFHPEIPKLMPGDGSASEKEESQKPKL